VSSYIYANASMEKPLFTSLLKDQASKYYFSQYHEFKNCIKGNN